MKLLVATLFSLLVLSIQSAIAVPTSSNSTELQYEYIIVGSGAGGGPLACRLAKANHSVLLIEAGNDQHGNINVSVPGYYGVVAQDPKVRWDMFVNHYQDQERAMRDPKYTYEVGPYQYHVGPDPPPGAKPLGILYPRAGTLGGCVTHNALVWILPQASDWNNIAEITGDDSWLASNMNQYLDKVYEWQPTEPNDPSLWLKDLTLSQHLSGGAAVMSVPPSEKNPLPGLDDALHMDINNVSDPKRDSTEGFFPIPLSMKAGTRVGVRDYIERTVAEGYPLTVRQNCFVTKIKFDESSDVPRATGVEFLDGEYLYHASPLSGGDGRKGSMSATKEVIISGGTYNTAQLLKLSGIGSSAELQNFNISTVMDLPGVGTNLQDRYEVPVNVMHHRNLTTLNGCTFDGGKDDECFTTWEQNPDMLDQRGPYASISQAAIMAIHSKYATGPDTDVFVFGGPIDFTGYFPGWGSASVADHKHFSWYTLKAHTRNTAGTVQLTSSDPLSPPLINFNYFDTGTTEGDADNLDLGAVVQAINESRSAISKYERYSVLGGDSCVEMRPGADKQSDEEIGQYVKDVAWGHHACCSNPIGADNDTKAVLDSQFRVRGVQNLRVVDASVFPKIPGIFIQAPIFMMSEKAADVIMNG